MRAIRLTDKMGCPIINTNYNEMIDCLRKVDAKKITRVISEFHVSFEKHELSLIENKKCQLHLLAYQKENFVC